VKKDPAEPQRDKPRNGKPQTEKPEKNDGPKQRPTRPAPKPRPLAAPAGEKKPTVEEGMKPGPVGDQYGSAVGEMISEVERDARKPVVKDPESEPRPPASNPNEPGVDGSVDPRPVEPPER
jgi:hypothetical protein